MKHHSLVLALLCLTGLLVPLITPMISGAENTLAWLIDLASHWQWPFLGGLLLFGAIAAWQQKRMAIPLLAAPLPWFTASEPAPATGADSPLLKVAASNIGLTNKEPGPLLDWLDAEGIDLAVLSEVSPAYADELRARSSFHYQNLAPRSGPFGLALLSRHPLAESEVLQDADGIPRIRATLLWQRQPVSVTALHPMPPLSTYHHRARNEALRAAARDAESPDHPGLLPGNLNASPWSSAMVGPSDAGYRRATGLFPTWPAVLQGLVGIQIDQILVSDHWAVRAAGTGPAIDSDHIPVWAALSLPADRAQN